MERLDRLGWVDSITFKAYGVKIGIRTNRAGTMEKIIPLLPPGWESVNSRTVDELFSLIVGGVGAQPGSRKFNILYHGLTRVIRTLDFDEALNRLESAVQLSVAEMAQTRVFVHAGVVGWKGRAIIIPGRTHSGKTTLVSALISAGATYYSDEYAILDRKGEVHPYPKLLGVRTDNNVQQPVHPSALGAKAGARPLPVGMIVFTRYREGVRWAPKCLSPGLGVLELIAHTVPIRRYPEKAMGWLNKTVERACILKGSRGEAGQVALELLDRFSRHN